jgi:CheY-like chemotaxis protein
LRALTDRGYDIRTAPDGESAITILEGLRTLPSLAITDLEMAGVDGEELARGLSRWTDPAEAVGCRAALRTGGQPSHSGNRQHARLSLAD